MAKLRKPTPSANPTHGKSIKEMLHEHVVLQVVAFRAKDHSAQYTQYDLGYVNGLIYSYALFLNPYKIGEESYVDSIKEQIFKAAVEREKTTVIPARKKRLRVHG